MLAGIPVSTTNRTAGKARHEGVPGLQRIVVVPSPCFANRRSKGPAFYVAVNG